MDAVVDRIRQRLWSDHSSAGADARPPLLLVVGDHGMTAVRLRNVLDPFPWQWAVNTACIAMQC